MKPIKVLSPKLYSEFCLEWNARLTKKFPKGMPITRKNLEWVCKRGYQKIGFGIYIFLRNTNLDMAHEWFWQTWCIGKENMIALALNIAKTGKLTPSNVKGGWD